MEKLPQLALRPKLHREVSAIIPVDFRTNLDEYLETRESIAFLSTYIDQLRVGSLAYNSSLINAIVVYVGNRAIDSLQEKSQQISAETVGDVASMDIFHELTTNLCLEGRLFYRSIYLFYRSIYLLFFLILKLNRPKKGFSLGLCRKEFLSYFPN